MVGVASSNLVAPTKFGRIKKPGQSLIDRVFLFRGWSMNYFPVTRPIVIHLG